MSEKRRKRKKKDKENIIPESQSQHIVADFSFGTAWVSVKKSDFTNHLKDDDQFYRFHKEIFTELLPVLKQQKFINPGDYINKIRHTLPHSHVIDNDDTVEDLKGILIEAVKKSKEYNKDDAVAYVEQNLGTEKIYQIGYRSIRLFGYFEENKFIIILIDYHHLLCPSIKYNQSDYKSYSLCPFTKGGK